MNTAHFSRRGFRSPRGHFLPLFNRRRRGLESTTVTAESPLLPICTVAEWGHRQQEDGSRRPNPKCLRPGGHRRVSLRPGGLPPGGKGRLSQPSGRGLSPPRVGIANSGCDDFCFRTTKPHTYSGAYSTLQEKSSLKANKGRARSGTPIFHPPSPRSPQNRSIWCMRSCRIVTMPMSPFSSVRQ